MKEIPSYLYSSNNGNIGEKELDEDVKICSAATKRAINSWLKYEECFDDNEVKINYLKRLAAINIRDMDTNHYILFLLNNGKYRTDEEIKQYNEKVRRANERKRIEQQKQTDYEYFTSGAYEEDCGNYGILCWLPLPICIIIAIVTFPCVFLGLEWLLIGLVLSLIFRAIYAHNCIEIADEHEYYKNQSERYKYEKTTKAASITGIVAGTAGLAKGAHNAHKEISNPDKWPKV